jgi:hypothetical protein
MPEKYRAPIVLCYLKEQTHDQAAAELRWPVGTVRSRLARGRELLKERLTRRGCSPATAMLGVGPGFSLRSFTASVPQPLVQATVAAAGRYLSGASSGVGPAALTFSSSSSLSGSATTLAQGVLTTMAFSQIKLISAGLTAVGLLAGGLGAGAWALGSSGTGQQANRIPAPASKTVEKTAAKPDIPHVAAESIPRTPSPDVATARPAPGVEARLADLERKIDLLLQRLNPPQLASDTLPTPPPQSQQAFEGDLAPRQARPRSTAGPAQLEPLPRTHSQPSSTPSGLDRQTQPSVDVVAFPRSARTRPDPLETPAPQRSSLKEIEVQIQIARQHFERSKALYAAAAIGKEAYEAPLDQIRLLIARLEGMDDDLADELERLKVEIVRKQALLKLAEAASIKSMNERKMVSKGGVSKGEAEDTAALLRIDVQRSEFEDVEIRMQQVIRRREMIKRDVNEVLKAIPEIARERGATQDDVPTPPRRSQ